MNITITINLDIEAPDSTGFSMDVMNLMNQILYDMIDTRGPKWKQIQALFDEDNPENISGSFECDYETFTVDSRGDYTVKLIDSSAVGTAVKSDNDMLLISRKTVDQAQLWMHQYLKKTHRNEFEEEEYDDYMKALEELHAVYKGVSNG